MPGLKLMAELGLDGSGFALGMNKARGVAEGVAAGMKNIILQAVGIGALEQAIQKTVETATDLVNESKRLAIAPEQLQILRQAAKEANVDMGTLAATMEKIGIARQQALIPGAEGYGPRRAFMAAGIGMDQLNSLTSAQLLLGPMAQMVKNASPDQFGIIFRELGIKGFGQLIPLLNTNFDELGNHMKKVGAIMDTETAVKLKAMGGEMGLVGQIIVSQLGPAIIKLVETIYQILLKIGGGWFATAAYGKGGSPNWDKMGWAEKGGMLLESMLNKHEVEAGRMSKEEAKVRMDALGGFDTDKAEAAAMAALGPWEDRLKQFRDMLDNFRAEAANLNNPKSADFSEPIIPQKMPKQALEMPTDNLVRIGNFLGAGRGSIARLAERRTQLLQQIERNTRARHGSASSAHSYIDANATFIPIA
ncbi:MAG TPA: hypothetical protein VG167_18955 [Verrucomicrobiae bacterium]|nr:hypothetical protein [Verrucomicrobiae bacterium]